LSRGQAPLRELRQARDGLRAPPRRRSLPPRLKPRAARVRPRRAVELVTFLPGLSRGRSRRPRGRSPASLSTRLCRRLEENNEAATPHTIGPGGVLRLETSFARTEAGLEKQDQRRDSRSEAGRRFQPGRRFQQGVT